MNKILLPFLLAFLSIDLVGQNRQIESQILDSEGNGVPFAAIGILDKNFGAITFEDGSFSISVNEKYRQDSLVISAIGFERKKISYERFVDEAPESIELNASLTSLEEVVITPEGFGLFRIGEKKKKSSNTLTFFSPQKGTTIAVLLNEENDLMQVKEIEVAVGKINLEQFQLRCWLFKMGVDSFPGPSMLQENLIQESSDKKSTITFKLSKDLWLDEPFYVGFEWIVSKAQFEEIDEVKSSFPTPFITEIDKAHPELKFTIMDNKEVQLRDQRGELKKTVELTKEQRKVLNARDEVNPRIFFQTHYKDDGLKTVIGSHISGEWRVNRFHALVSLLVGMSRE